MAPHLELGAREVGGALSRVDERQARPVRPVQRFATLMDSELVGLTGGVPREQSILKGHLPRVIYNQVC